MSICMYAKIMVRFTLDNREEDEDNRTDEYPIEFQLGDIQADVEDYLIKNVVSIGDFDLEKDVEFSDDCDGAFVNVTIPAIGNSASAIESGIEKIILRIGHNAKILKD